MILERDEKKNWLIFKCDCANEMDWILDMYLKGVLTTAEQARQAVKNAGDKKLAN